MPFATVFEKQEENPPAVEETAETQEAPATEEATGEASTIPTSNFNVG